MQLLNIEVLGHTGSIPGCRLDDPAPRLPQPTEVAKVRSATDEDTARATDKPSTANQDARSHWRQPHGGMSLGQRTRKKLT